VTSKAETPAINPAERSIGQLVADTIRFYGSHFWASLALGVGPALLAVVASQLGRVPAVAVSAGGAVAVFTASYVAASAMVAGVRPSSQRIIDAMVVGILVYLPAPFLFLVFVLPGIAWFALFGLAVPAAVAERLGVMDALRRGLELGRADFVHALATLGTLGLLVFLTGQVMAFVIHGASGEAIQIALYLATLVLTPLLFLGAAHLYDDQVARAAAAVESERKRVDKEA
jgi:hypothetical protein